MAAQVQDKLAESLLAQIEADLKTAQTSRSQIVKLLSDISLAAANQLTLSSAILAKLDAILAVLNPPVGTRASFSLEGASMPQQTGTTFSILDSAPKTGYSLAATLLDADGHAATFTAPQFGAVSDPQSVLANFASADQITGTFDITGNLGSAQIPWSGTNSEGTVVSGTATISVTSGAGVTVSFTLTTP